MSKYNSFKKGKISFYCDYGELVFYKRKDNECIVHGIYIFPEYRQQGFCRDILHYLIDQSTDKFKYVCVQSVISKILYNYLLRFTYKNKKFTNTKSGFVYAINY